jgi:adenine phosphoribosyltransferase
MNLLDYIPIVQDFPKPGVGFRDVSPLLANPNAFSKALDLLNDQFAQSDYDVIAGIDSRGFIFGTALARLTGKPFVMIRKANKLPPETLRVSYELEYGSDHLEIRKGLLQPTDRVLIVDDVLATGGTLLASKQLIEMAGARVCGALTLLEIAFLGGSKKLAQQNLLFRAALCV